MKRLLSQRAAASYCGLGVRTFRLMIAEGVGPRAFDPLNTRPRYAVSVLDEWLHERNDSQSTKAERGAA